MIQTQLYPQSVTVNAQPSAEDYLVYSRILAAAIVSPRFQTDLLTDPGSALQSGYQGETFQLSDDGWTWLLSKTTDSLPGLASQLVPTTSSRSTFSPSYQAQPSVFSSR